MAHNKGKYKAVDRLPPGATTVKEYCKDEKFSIQWFYKQIRDYNDKKVKYLKFDVVIWKTHNYVVPKSEKRIKELETKFKKNLA